MYDYFTRLHDYLSNASKKHPERRAIICNKREFTYQEIDYLSDQVGIFLAEMGLVRGDRVVVCLGNTIETVLTFWGVLKIGGIISIIHPETEIKKIEYILSDAKPFAYVGKGQTVAQLDDFFSNNKFIKQIIIADKIIETDKTTSFENILSKNKQLKKPIVLDIDVASIIYTSGSTGEPKGVMMTHRNMLAASSSINEYLGHESDDKIISALPISFDYGLYQLIMATSVGATLILEKNFFFPGETLKKISHFSATVFPLVPTMIPLIQEHSDKFRYDLSSIRSVTNTGAALNVKHIEILKMLFQNAKIFSMYGLTECKRCSYLPPDMINKKPTSIGIPIPNTEIWVVDDKGNRLGKNQVGELVVRGSTVMKGYWNKSIETEKKLKQGILPDEKLLFTGDYGWFDEDNYLYFQGRMDEVLKCRGMKVSPKEIEDILISISEVNEAVVIGVEDFELGTAICAFISSSIVSKETIQKFCINHLPSEKRPSYIFVQETLPKTSNGKIDKLALKKMANNKITSKTANSESISENS